jgi:NAD(P)H-dependent FMN reductase
MQPHVVAISGSLREGSRTLKAAEVALRGASIAGATTELVDLRRVALPFFDARKDETTYPSSVWELLDPTGRADGLILASPVYHGTVSGALKNALDFLHLLGHDGLDGKVVGLISVAGGGEGTNTLNTLEYIARSLHLWTMPMTVAVPGSAFCGDGELHDVRISKRLIDLGREVGHLVGLLSGARAAGLQLAT